MPLIAQLPFADAEGESSMVLRDGGLIQFNTGNGTVQLALQHDTSDDDTKYGIGIAGKLGKDTADIFNGSDLATGLTIAATRTSYFNQTKRPSSATSSEEDEKLDWFTLRASYSRSKLSFIEATAPIASQITEREFDGYSFSMHYNSLRNGDLLYGASVGWAKKNNVDEMKKVEYEDRTTIAAGGVVRDIVVKKSALAGNYRKLDTLPVNLDIAWLPAAFNRRIVINPYWHSDLKESDLSAGLGLGLYLVKEGHPTAVLGGLNFFEDDNKLKAQLTVGYFFD